MNIRHSSVGVAEWDHINELRRSKKPILLNGNSLSVAQVIAVCMHGSEPKLDTASNLAERIQQSIDFLEDKLQDGRVMYGVNTGFGGSADTRSDEAEKLQIALQQHLNVGILLPSDKGRGLHKVEGEVLRGHALPVMIVKAMMLIRSNSLLRAHSGVRISILSAILTLINKDMTPIVPLRGSISASGDLSTLSYIPGLLEGNPDVYVRTKSGEHHDYMPAAEALKYAGLSPIKLRAKEGLGLTNGTSASCAAACIATHQADQIALLSQLLTAMATEALLGTTHNYHPFISEVRLHPGQVEAAANIRALLCGSSLAFDNDPQKGGLAQDRYALRTAPQWIGPQLEDLQLARRQVEIELNSTTDNPLIDVKHGTIHHGGNFQAASLTSAMEKTMTAMQMLGRLMNAQCAELIDNKLNKGLPPNLCADDPGLSFTFKGFDVNMTAYMSELAYLAHPVSSHVLSSEMNNQSINSLALIASRYTLEAIEVVSLMAATYLYALCQALDLRCLHLEFAKSAEPKISKVLEELFRESMSKQGFEDFKSQSWRHLLENWSTLSNFDLANRGPTAAQRSLGRMVQQILQDSSIGDEKRQTGLLDAIHEYQIRAGEVLNDTYGHTRSKVMYEYVRKDLGVPMHRGLVDHPNFPASESERGKQSNGKILGSYASDIYMSLRSVERIDQVLIDNGNRLRIHYWFWGTVDQSPFFTSQLIAQQFLEQGSKQAVVHLAPIVSSHADIPASLIEWVGQNNIIKIQ